MPSKHNLIVSLVCLFSLTAFGADNSPRCYQFTAGDIQAITDRSASRVTESEIWCYERVNSPKSGVMIFNMDMGRAKRETTLFVGDDGYLIQSSLLAGKITTHRVKATDYNPLSVPLVEPNPDQRISMRFDAPIQNSKKEIFNKILSSRAEDAPMGIEEGTFEATASVMPWRGYWFPQRGQTIAPALRKYDAYVKAKTGKSPESVRYERNHHGWSGEVWEGHCNGWAAAAILNEEPMTAKTDAGVTFSVLDQKALLIERDFCVTHTFFGSRYRDEGDNLSDIRPALFHKTLVYYIGGLQKPVATDYNKNVTVDNAVISGYKMVIKKTASRTFKVNAVVSLHHYDKVKSDAPGIAKAEQKKYNYTIRVNDAGEIIGGNWTSGNPDFLWVPLSHSACRKNNQRLDVNVIEQILNIGSTPIAPEPTP